MDEQKLDRLVNLSHDDFMAGDLRRAKDRLHTVLQLSPQYQPALELIGHVYYLFGDYRNAVMHWSRANRWSDPMPDACEHVFKSVNRALARENSKAIRYHLYAFAGTAPPREIKNRLATLQQAYYGLSSKKSKQAGLACAPICGACLLGLLGVTSVVLGAGWSWFIWMGALAMIATIVVTSVNAWSYFKALRMLREAILSSKLQGIKDV